MLTSFGPRSSGWRADAAPLEPDADARRALGGAGAGSCARLSGTRSRTAPTNRPGRRSSASRLDPEFTEEGRDPATSSTTSALHRRARLRHHQSRGSWPISRAAAVPYSALGDLLAATSNKYSGFASASPGAVRIENACTKWLAERHRLSGRRGRHADVGRKHRQSHRHRRRPRGARSGGRRRGLRSPASHIIASTRRSTSPAAAARRAG